MAATNVIFITLFQDFYDPIFIFIFIHAMSGIERQIKDYKLDYSEQGIR